MGDKGMPASPNAPDENARAAVRSTKRGLIVSELRQMIARGELARGSRVQQDVLAELFQTSITPVREAIRQLEAEGLLVAQPHRGVRVADADYGQVKTTYLLRRLIEPYAMQRAIRRTTPRDLERAQRLVDSMEAAALSEDRPLLNALNWDFHFLFYANLGDNNLLAYIETLWQQFPWDVLQVVADRGQHSSQEHREILTACKAGDLDLASKLTETHLMNSFLSLAAHLTGENVEDPFLADND